VFKERPESSFVYIDGEFGEEMIIKRAVEREG
jgi:hypothetical protein